MRKKIIALLILATLVATLFSGCTFIKENEERAANEVLATVTVGDISLTVTKNELLAYVNYMATQYSNYNYTPDYETLIPEIYDYMIGQKYLIIQGMLYLKSLDYRQATMVSNNMNVSVNTPEGVLTLAERYNAIKTTNETFEEEIDGYIADYEDEQKNLAISKAKEEIAILLDGGYKVDSVTVAENSFKEEYLAKEELDESKVFLNINLKKGDVTKTVKTPVSSTMYDEDATFSTELTTDEQTNKVVEKEVIVFYEEPYTNSEGETEYTVHKAEPVTYNVVTPRGTETVEEEENVLEGDVEDRYELDANIAADNKASYFDYNVNTTVALKEAYRQFREEKKAMLINFTEDGLAYYYDSQFESAVLAAVKHELAKAADVSNVTNAKVEEEYAILVNRQKEEYNLLATDEAKVNKFATSIVTSSSINLEKTYYIPVTEITAEGYALNEFIGIAHILFKFDEVQSAFVDKEGSGMSDEALLALQYAVAQSTSTRRSNPNYDAEYECPLHSDNEGVCNYTGEGICPALAFDPDNLDSNLFTKDADIGIYEELSAALAAAATDAEKLEIFKDYMALYNDDGGAMTTSTGYLISPEGIKHSYDGDDFPGLAWKLFDESATIGSSFLNTNSNPYLGYAFTSYGLHLMTISFLPFADPATVSATGTLSIDAALDLDGTTHRQLITDSLKGSLQDAAYTKFTETYNSDAALAAAEKETKKFEKLMKDLGYTD